MENRFDDLLEAAMQNEQLPGIEKKPLDHLCYLALRAVFDGEGMIPEITRLNVRRIKVAYREAVKDRAVAEKGVRFGAEKYIRTEEARTAIYKAENKNLNAQSWRELALGLAEAIDGVRRINQ